ncbi:MAG: TfoX/Sxy family protein [Steroidobacteraceae bacterium]
MSDLTDSLPDLFHGLGHVHTRPMFGGRGVYADEVFFAIIQGGTLYLKADQISRAHFIERGLKRFEYVKQGKVASLGYYEAPPEVLEDPDEALRWGKLAIDAARRAADARR